MQKSINSSAHEAATDVISSEDTFGGTVIVHSSLPLPLSLSDFVDREYKYSLKNTCFGVIESLIEFGVSYRSVLRGSQ